MEAEVLLALLGGVHLCSRFASQQDMPAQAFKLQDAIVKSKTMGAAAAIAFVTALGPAFLMASKATNARCLDRVIGAGNETSSFEPPICGFGGESPAHNISISTIEAWASSEWDSKVAFEATTYALLAGALVSGLAFYSYRKVFTRSSAVFPALGDSSDPRDIGGGQDGGGEPYLNGQYWEDMAAWNRVFSAQEEGVLERDSCHDRERAR
jgi:hypothetical protein